MGVILSDPPFTFRKFLGGGSLARFLPQGVDCKVFECKAPENRTEGAVLEHYFQFFGNIVS